VPRLSGLAAFTLIELLVVIAIIAILAAMLVDGHTEFHTPLTATNLIW
jgi:prepilin-type N-terminal cleavage/methylation domain-containing protein